MREQEARLAETVGRAMERQELGPGTECVTRLLGRTDAAQYVWAECTSSDHGAISVPARVEGAGVDLPRDGALYAEDVRRLFPKGLAKVIVSDPDRLRP